MELLFGMDSRIPANFRLKNGYTLYDWVMRQNGFPAFWGRDLDGAYPATAEEVEYLHGKNCRVAWIIRDLNETAVSKTDGKVEAVKAIKAAKARGIPTFAGVALFAEIQPHWSVNHNWMISFAQELVRNGFVPGFIGNTDSSKNFNFDRQCSHYVQGTCGVREYGAIYWATEPKRDGEPQAWEPFCPSAMQPEDIHLWQCDSVWFDTLYANCSYLKDKKILQNLW